jgi:hypothetical protein
VIPILIHMGLEAVGGLVAWYAYGFCKHWHHRLLVYLALSFVFSVLTVHLVG